MKLSNRIQSITGDGSDGWDILYRSRDMIDAGIPVLELTIGEHDNRTDPSIIDEMYRSAKAGNTGYAAVPGNTDLREAIAARVQAQSGVPTTKDNVIVTTGGQAALFAAHLALLDHGDTGLFMDPYYATYPGGIRSIGSKSLAVPTHSDHNFQPQRADLEPLAKSAKSLLINSPNNPTGVIYSRETLEMICDVCLTNDVVLVSDEVYDTQVWEGEHISPRSLPNMADNCFVIGSMSKSHAMTGWRVGWIIGPKDAIDRILDLSTINTYGVPGFIQDAATFALTNGTELETEVANVFRNRLLMAREILKDETDIRLIPAQGAMYLMLDIRATGLSGDDFADQLLTQEHIAVMPGESFGASAAGHIRVAMTIPDDDFKTALTRLIAFAKSKIA
ncbi:pyridoxal phosphate-dependent aminotransferase [Amylibacter sp. IMCC11727]|uniref:pyridoxal phosphate-dependent aminotransferase n=1 Tax=Amylibacter sp. IMCC11727 TaxID=3039851 RepID=UPI00244E331A|nr:pyridoxal phosphate-dependent aminotransferase [Amylibacter sp. IMCC11727]WGI20894.1 pyridoxal phosphate-dependent aminotransferase [Amylibacter sp. IMCC11727]